MLCVFIHLYANPRSWAHRGEQLVESFHSDAIKPSEKKSAQQDAIIKSTSVKPQTMENNVENAMKILHLCLFYVLI